jgi:hypothetical protein
VTAFSRFRDRLQHGDILFGASVCFSDPRVTEAATANGLSVGVGVPDAATAAAMAVQGAQWVQLSGAEAYLWQRFEQLCRQARESLAS